MPAKSKGKIKINISKIPAGMYKVQIYKVGYRSNDPYTTYLDMGRPSQLTKEQVQKIKKFNNGSPMYSENLSMKTGEPSLIELDLNENDVFLVTMSKQ